MVDYKAIADGDPGGDLDSAYTTMAAETVITTPEKLMTYRSIANEVGFAASAELEAGVLNDSNGMPSWLHADLAARGIDVNNPDVGALIGVLVSAPTATAILAAGQVPVAVYTGLKVGHLQNARQQRAAGEI